MFVFSGVIPCVNNKRISQYFDSTFGLSSYQNRKLVSKLQTITTAHGINSFGYESNKQIEYIWYSMLRHTVALTNTGEWLTIKLILVNLRIPKILNVC